MTAFSNRAPRRLDHLVLPTAALDGARHRLSDLGFTVAPTAEHPFGTENACVYFADGTYLEPLAVGHREACEAAARAGNVFLRHDQAFRFRRGEEGFSALVMSTADAAQDRSAFVAAGLSAGENLSFSRPYVTRAGTQAEARFELAFAADLRAPDAFFFTCQRVLPLEIDRSALQRHANGVVGIRQVVLSERNPSDFQYLLQEVINQREVSAHSFGIDLEAENAEVTVLNVAGLRGFFGLEDDSGERGVRLCAIVFATTIFDLLEQRFRQARIGFERVGQRLVVPAARGQGAVFAFEQA